MNYKMILAYDGTRYNGWQKQGNTDRTIQGKLEQILTRMAGGPIEVFGSGRTDRGVHAEGQTANFHLKQTEVYRFWNISTPTFLRILRFFPVRQYRNAFTAV